MVVVGVSWSYDNKLFVFRNVRSEMISSHVGDTESTIPWEVNKKQQGGA